MALELFIEGCLFNPVRSHMIHEQPFGHLPHEEPLSTFLLPLMFLYTYER